MLCPVVNLQNIRRNKLLDNAITPANNIIDIQTGIKDLVDFADGDEPMIEVPLINTFDIDGVIYMGDDFTGVWPGPEDIIITGRSICEMSKTLDILTTRGIFNQVVFNPLRRDDPKYSREASGKHKAETLLKLLESYSIGIHFEDDPIQIEIIESYGLDINIVHLQHTLTVK